MKISLLTSMLVVVSLLHQSTCTSIALINNKYKSHPNLQKKYTPPVYLNITLRSNFSSYGNALLEGLNADEYAANTSNCYNRMMDFYFFELPLLQIRFYYGDSQDIVYNVTGLISNLSNHVLICNDALDEYVDHILEKYEIFPTPEDYFLAMVQNLLSNIITFKNIYIKIARAVGTNSSVTNQTYDQNITEIIYYTGRIINIVFEFPPIQFASIKKPQLKQERIKPQPYEQYDMNFSNIGANLTEGAKQLLSFGGIVNFTVGIIKGSGVVKSNRLVLCWRELLFKWVDESTVFVNYSAEGQAFDAIRTFFGMTYNIDSVFHKCHVAFEESLYGYKQLILLYQEPKYLMENIIYNFGQIYTNIRDLASFFSEEQRGSSNIPLEAGQLIGNSFYLVFTPINNATSNNQENVY